MKLKYNYIIQEVADNYIAVPILDGEDEKISMISLNGCGRFIFECLQQELDENQILLCMKKEYEAESKDLEYGLVSFLTELRNQGVLID